jgi:hypothetical protein
MKDEEEEFIYEEVNEETFLFNGKEYQHTERWKLLMEKLHRLSPHEQDKMRAEIRAEARRELERITAKQN